jgi:ATP-binding cassette subfamily F protein 3
MLLKPMNLLILDEPTNHLDLYSKDILLDTLKAFTGTVIFVSHDRSFMEALSTKTLELTAGETAGPGVKAGAVGRSRLFFGDYAYYLDRFAAETASGEASVGGEASLGEESSRKEVGTPPILPGTSREPQGAASDATQSAVQGTTQSAAQAAALIYPAGDEKAPGTPRAVLLKPGVGAAEALDAAARREAGKQRQSLIRRLERQEVEALTALEALEAEKRRLEVELGQPEVYRSGDKARELKRRLEGLTADIAVKVREWEARAEELEAARA